MQGATVSLISPDAKLVHTSKADDLEMMDCNACVISLACNEDLYLT